MDIGRAINYVFQDSEWIKKIAIAGVLLIIPIIGWLAVLGYFMRNIRQVATGTDLPLPEWNDFGGDFMRGLKGFVAVLVWELPVIAIYACVILPLNFAGGEDGSAGLALLSTGAGCIVFILSLALAFMMPLVLSRVAMTENIASALDFSAIFNEAKTVATPLLVTVLVTWVISFVASFGIILCFIGVFFTTALGYVMATHLYGQLRRQLDRGVPVSSAGVPLSPPI